MYFAIQVVGSGKRRRYGVVKVTGAALNPTTGRSYSTESEARSAAAALGVEVRACGDLWQIINKE